VTIAPTGLIMVSQAVEAWELANQFAKH